MKVLGNTSSILGDICILNLENLQWIKIEQNGLKNIKKCAFSSIIVDSSIIIFGGHDEGGFSNADL